jgi:hypothetical protein
VGQAQMNKLLNVLPQVTLLLAFAVIVWFLKVRKIPFRSFSKRLTGDLFDVGAIIMVIGFLAMLILFLIHRFSN